MLASKSNPITFRAIGRPTPKGRLTAFVPTDRDGEPYRRAGGSIVVNVTESSGKKLGAWMNAIRLAASLAYKADPIVGEAMVVETVFLFRRPKSHYGTGRNAGKLKKSAPRYLTTKGSTYGDVDKLTRGVLDALTGLVYGDDGQVVATPSFRRWTSGADCAEIKVYSLER